MSNVFVGPAGWSYPDWDGIVYPHKKPSKFDALAYIARYFTAVEVNSSFYRTPPARTTSSWVRRVADVDPFWFAFKLQQTFTHERGDYTRAEVDAYLEALKPVAEAGRLGCVLAQFPWSFRYSRAALDWLGRLWNDFGRYPLVAEVRHASWDSSRARDALRRMEVGLCNIDQPGLPRCLDPADHVTSRVGYVRLHGRRRDTWFADGVPVFERYNYLYTSSQLEEWVPRIARVADAAERVFVFTNNHYRGQGPANALQLRALLSGDRVEVPATLRAAFPELAAISRPGDDPGPATLFDF